MSHMGVQTFATRRNELAELLINYIIQKFVDDLYESELIIDSAIVERQKAVERDDAQDVFDHFVEFELTQSMDGQSENHVQIWCQTTNYKGNRTGKPESNKTYEIRETVIESLGLRRGLRESDVFFRTIHFTVGPSGYTYAWFKSVKDNSFDLSLYPELPTSEISLFDELIEASNGIEMEFEYYNKLDEIVSVGDAKSQITSIVKGMLSSLHKWFQDGMPVSEMANQQADLLTELRHQQAKALQSALIKSKQGGMDIKNTARKLLEEGKTDDVAMIRTLKRLTNSNPFLAIALEAESEWENWSKLNFMPNSTSEKLDEYIHRLWSTSDDARLINRRLLLRIHSDDAIFYIQDVGIEGITEHNLYAGDHTDKQINRLVKQIMSACTDAGLESPFSLYEVLSGKQGLNLLRASRRFESKNGTSIKPSFFYIEEALSSEYEFVSIKDLKIADPIAYHHAFTDETVRPYSNLKAVVHRETRKVCAIIKAKFFRKPEFPRRAKEEAYVGLTTKYDLMLGQFVERYPGIPLIMFVDMPKKLKPQEYAVTRLVTCGWLLFFQVSELKAYLDSKVQE